MKESQRTAVDQEKSYVINQPHTQPTKVIIQLNTKVYISAIER